MATTSAANGGVKRYFSIGRLQFKDDGRPIFREYLGKGDAPEPNAARTLETRDGYHFEAFTGLSGVITKAHHKAKEISGIEQTMFIIEMVDGPETYVIEMGNWDGRYTMNFMQRMCNDAFNPGIPSNIGPYYMTNKETGKPNMGCVIKQNGVTIEARRDEPGMFDVPKPITTVKRTAAGPGKWIEKTEWDFSPVAQFFVDYVNAYVVPNFPGMSMEQVNAPVVQSRPSNARETSPVPPSNASHFPTSEFPTQQPKPVGFDDLPF